MTPVLALLAQGGAIHPGPGPVPLTQDTLQGRVVVRGLPPGGEWNQRSLDQDPDLAGGRWDPAFMALKCAGEFAANALPRMLRDPERPWFGVPVGTYLETRHRSLPHPLGGGAYVRQMYGVSDPRPGAHHTRPLALHDAICFRPAKPRPGEQVFPIFVGWEMLGHQETYAWAQDGVLLLLPMDTIGHSAGFGPPADMLIWGHRSLFNDYSQQINEMHRDHQWAVAFGTDRQKV